MALNGRNTASTQFPKRCNMFSISRFAKLTQNIPRKTFDKAVFDSNSDLYAKKLKTWDLLLILMYGQILQVDSLRRLVKGFNMQSNHLYHLNTQKTKRSTLSDALNKRSAQALKITFDTLVKTVARQRRKKLPDFTYLLDSTPIKLNQDRFTWPENTMTRRGSGLKVHMCVDLQNLAPVYTNITSLNVNDVTDCQNLELERNATYVFDKGYCDYNWWHQINEVGAFFVTRLKENAAIKVISSVNTNGANIIKDEVIQLTNKRPGGKRTNRYAHKDLRRVTIKRDGKDKPMVLVTNDMERSAEELSQLYKDRWKIELLFKWLKQKLKLKTYFGRSHNAVVLQIYAALISYILMILEHTRSQSKISLSEYYLELKYGLFQREATEDYCFKQRRREEKIRRDIQPELRLCF